MIKKKKSPWMWLPTLYIAEGLPYFAINTLSVIIYTKLGIGEKEMAFFTGWLYLPWVIKPFWSPFVDLIKTKRIWILWMQGILATCMACIAFSLSLPFFFAATLSVFWLMAFFSATHDIAADGYYMLELTHHEQAAYVGVRSTFYRIASVIGQGGLVMLAGHLETSTGNIPLAWGIVFGTLSIFFAAVTIYHSILLPHAPADIPRTDTQFSDVLKDFGRTFKQFFAKKHIATALAFMLLYRLPEAMLLKLVPPFLLNTRANGGLALTTEQVGFVNGTVGVIGLLAGGILGGLAISRYGLKKCLWPMALALTLPCAFYCFLAMSQPDSFLLLNIGIFLEQFGYGFGFTAYMLYLIYFSEGTYKTAFYAFCTAFMALGMMLPGMAAGWLCDQFENINIFNISGTQRYVNFFWWVMICCIPTYMACALIKIDPDFGKKQTT